MHGADSLPMEGSAVQQTASNVSQSPSWTPIHTRSPAFARNYPRAPYRRRIGRATTLPLRSPDIFGRQALDPPREPPSRRHVDDVVFWGALSVVIGVASSRTWSPLRPIDRGPRRRRRAGAIGSPSLAGARVGPEKAPVRGLALKKRAAPTWDRPTPAARRMTSPATPSLRQIADTSICRIDDHHRADEMRA